MRKATGLFLAVVLICAAVFPLAASAAPELPEVAGQAALVLHPETGLVIYAKDADRKLPPAGLVKIMTALLAVEHLPDRTAELTMTDTALEGLSGLTTAGLRKGERMSVEGLLCCLLLPSAADAANLLAEAVSGDVKSFVALMNRRAAELGMLNTHFTNPHGGDDPRQLTTASDLAKLAQAAMKNQTLADMVGTQYKRIIKTNLSTGDRYYFSNNALIISSAERRKVEDYYYSPAEGIMTGYSAQAGYTLMAQAKKGGLRLICIVLGAPRAQDGSKSHYTDAVALLGWSYANLQYITLLKQNEPVCEVEVSLASTRDAMTLVPEFDYSAIIPAQVEPADLQLEYRLQEHVEAPVDKGQQLGQVVFSYGGKVYGSCALVAQSDVSRSPLLFILDRIAAFFGGRWSRITLSVLGLVVVGYLVLTLQHNRRKTRRKRRRSGLR